MSARCQNQTRIQIREYMDIEVFIHRDDQGSEAYCQLSKEGQLIQMRIILISCYLRVDVFQIKNPLFFRGRQFPQIIGYFFSGWILCVTTPNLDNRHLHKRPPEEVTTVLWKKNNEWLSNRWSNLRENSNFYNIKYQKIHYNLKGLLYPFLNFADHGEPYNVFV